MLSLVLRFDDSAVAKAKDGEVIKEQSAMNPTVKLVFIVSFFVVVVLILLIRVVS